MKKLISIFVSLSLILSVFTVMVVNSEELKENENIDFLLKTKIIDEAKDGSSVVTRGEFSENIYKLIFPDSTVENSEAVYKDVDENNKYFQSINFVTQIGLMTGYEDNTFMPDYPMSVEECKAVFVRLLGYGIKAQAKGGFPTGYNLTANELGLSANISGGNGSLNYDDFYTILYNSLFVYIADPISFGKTVEYDSENEKTILNTYLNIDFVKGIISDNGITAIDSETQIKKNAILVNDVIVEDADRNAVEMLGYNVTVYYKFSQNEGNKFLFLEVENSKNNVLVIYAKDIISANANEVTYKSNSSKIKTVKISSTADYIYNGNATLNLSSQMMNIKNGSLKLLDNDSDNAYNLLFVEEYQPMLVMRITDKNVIYGAYDESVDLSEYDDIYVMKNGNQISISDITPYDVIAVYKSDVSAKIEVCTTVIFGELKEIKQENNNQKCIINDAEYELAAEFVEAINNNIAGITEPTVGEEGTFYIGKDNKIVFYETETSEKLGILSHFSGKKGGFGSTPKVKIFSQDGEWHEAEIDKRVEFNGTKIDNEDIFDKTELFDANNQFKRQLVRYSINSDGKVTYLETVDETKPDDDSLQEMSCERRFKYSNVSFIYIEPTVTMENMDNRLAYLTGSYIFNIPTNPNDIRYYSVSRNTIPGKTHDTGITCSVYFSSYKDKFSARASAVVYKTDASLDGAFPVRSMAVTGISKKLNADGEVVDLLTGFYKGKETQYEATPGIEINGIEAGDIIQIKTDNNVISRYRKVYSTKLNMGCTEWYQECQREFSQGTEEFYTKLCQFYNVDYSRIDEIDDLDHYVYKNLVMGNTTYNAYSSTVSNTNFGLNGSNNSNTLTATVLKKNGNYFQAEALNGKTYTYQCGPNIVDYYRCYVYKLNREENTVTAATVEDFGKDGRIFFCSEAAAVIDLLIIE